jgi:hypothetical protein
MTDVIEVGMPAAACDRVLGALRRRLAEVEAWKNGSVKDVGREAVREEMARVGRAMAELGWRWA